MGRNFHLFLLHLQDLKKDSYIVGAPSIHTTHSPVLKDISMNPSFSPFALAILTILQSSDSGTEIIICSKPKLRGHPRLLFSVFFLP